MSEALKLRPDHPLLGRQRLENRVGQRAEDVHRGDADGLGRDDPGTAAEVERLLVQLEDRPVGPLQGAGVVVVAGTGVEVRQEQDPRRLALGQGPEDQGPGLVDDRVLPVGQPEGGREVDRIRRGRLRDRRRSCRGQR